MLPVGILLASRLHPVVGIMIFGAGGISARLLLNAAWDSSANAAQLVPFRDDLDGLSGALGSLRLWEPGYWALMAVLWVAAIASLVPR